MERKAIVEWYQPIIIDKSRASSKDLIMPHQDEAVSALSAYFELDKPTSEQNGLVVMPTGSGKTFTAVNWLLSKCVPKDYRVLWLAHRQELIDQTYKEFVEQSPILAESGKRSLRVLPISGMHAPMSVASGCDIYVCSIASAANKHGMRFIRRMIGNQGKKNLIVLIDEAHHAVSAQYTKVLKRITDFNPNRILLGLTATPKRMQEREWYSLLRLFNVDKNQKLGLGNCKGYVYDVSLKQLIVSGFLARPIHEPVKTQIMGEIEYEFSEEDEKFFSRFGELPESIQSQIARSSARNNVIIDQYMKNQDRYGKTLIFAVNQDHAETLSREMKSRGVSCDYVVSRKPGAQETIAAFKKNEFTVLINVQILTEGSDVPDIQTVFLTRETNSDSLLMQMIGRGLRGPRANGTEVAYIVDFHDTWEKYAFWLDPGKLIIDNIDPTDGSAKKGEPEKPDLTSVEKETDIDTNAKEFEEILSREPSITLFDIYYRLYQSMKAVWKSETESAIIPVGWYSVVDNKGEELKVLVYEDQLYSYDRIKKDIALLMAKRITYETCISKYFSNCSVQPAIEELDSLLNYIYDTKEMPQFFNFEERKYIDPQLIAEQMKVKGLIKDDHKLTWLKELYDSSPIIRQIYKTFFAFRTSILQAEKAKVAAEIIRQDERKQFSIVEQYHNLSSLYKEVIDMYPALGGNHVVQVDWSQKVYKSWLGLCIVNDDRTKFLILINRVLCSPQVSKESIKYLIYHELLHASGLWNHDDAFRDEEWRYPNSDELDGQLDELCIRYDLNYDEERRRNRREAPGIRDISTRVFGKSTENQPALPDHENRGFHTGVKYCRECGNKLPDTAKFCDRCGKEMNY